MSKHVPGKNWYAEYKTNKNIHLTHIWPHTHTDFSHLFSSIPGNGIVGCDPEEVVANSGRRLLRGPWSKIVKIASSLKSLEKEFWEISRELSPCYSLVILAFVRWKNGEKMGTPHGYPVVRTTQQGVGDPLPARVFAGTSWRLLCQQRWMPSPQRWCTPFRPGCWCPALHGIRQPIPEDDGLATKILICACHIPQSRLDVVGMILLMAEILHQLRLVVFPIIYRVLCIPGGCLGVLPSTDR